MLKLENVCAGYDGQDVVHDVTIEFTPGQNYCLLGPNGCGKTTLLRAMAGLIPHGGKILLDGTEIARMKRGDLAARIAVMSQINNVYFSYTVFDTVMLGRYQHMKGRLFGHPSAEDKAVVERCLASTGLLEYRNRQIDELSGGQRQRVFLAHALAQDPEIILLDEPTNHLDVRHQVELIDYLHKWTADGKHSVIGVFHDVNLALRLTGNVLFMNEGRIVRQGDFHKVADAGFLREIYGMDLAAFMKESLSNWSNL